MGNDIDASARSLLRSPTSIFFMILFPIIFILVLGAIFSGVEDPFNFELYVQNQDEGMQVGPTIQHLWNDTLRPVIESLNNSAGDPLILIKDVPLKDQYGSNISAGEYLERQEGYICLVVPEHFTQQVFNVSPINMTLIMDETSQSAQVVAQILSKVFYEFNLGLSGGYQKADLVDYNILVGREITYAEYLVPGMIAITFMNNALMGAMNRFTYYRITGFFKKLSSSPMRRMDFVTSETLWEYIKATVALLVSVLTGWLAFGISWKVMNWMIFPIMLAGVMTFTGLGMIGSRLVKSTNAAAAVGNVLSYPMMFLSGAMFDVSAIPALNIISKCLPLTYVVDALRASMITKNMTAAWMNLGISLGLAVVFMTIGIIVTKWTDD